MKRIWMRVGMAVNLTDDMYDELVNASNEGDCNALYHLFETMIKNSELCGETYILGKENGGVDDFDNPEQEISVDF